MADFRGGGKMALYEWAISNNMRCTLFEMEMVLSGKSGDFRLVPERLQEARTAFATIYRIVAKPELEPTPKAIAANKAQHDPEFQRFMQQATTAPKKYRKKLSHLDAHWTAAGKLDSLAKQRRPRWMP
jgi:hypothetical protein